MAVPTSFPFAMSTRRARTELVPKSRPRAYLAVFVTMEPPQDRWDQPVPAFIILRPGLGATAGCAGSGIRLMAGLKYNISTTGRNELDRDRPRMKSHAGGAMRTRSLFG